MNDIELVQWINTQAMICELKYQISKLQLQLIILSWKH